jgi:D-galactose 1-dehydrogenase
MTIRIGLVGLGKIALDEHIPAIAANPDFALVAAATHGQPPNLSCPVFSSPARMYAAMEDQIDAVAICTPPEPRFGLAGEAIDAGLAVLLEKPPTILVSQLLALSERAKTKGVSIYTAWHSQHAAGVNLAQQALVNEDITLVQMTWREDVREYHPNQDWIWSPSGFGVFDPGINGLSILTQILPHPLYVHEASLEYPSNRKAPIFADLQFEGPNHNAVMDWRGIEADEWSIVVQTQGGRIIQLSRGGAELSIDGIAQDVGSHNEYRGIYADFSKTFLSRQSVVDAEPLRIMSEALTVGERHCGVPFI